MLVPLADRSGEAEAGDMTNPQPTTEQLPTGNRILRAEVQGIFKGGDGPPVGALDSSKGDAVLVHAYLAETVSSTFASVTMEIGDDGRPVADERLVARYPGIQAAVDERWDQVIARERFTRDIDRQSEENLATLTRSRKEGRRTGATLALFFAYVELNNMAVNLAEDDPKRVGLKAAAELLAEGTDFHNEICEKAVEIDD